MPEPKRVTYWSYSMLKKYRQCPRKVKLGTLDKIKEPSSPAMERGTKIHKEAEDYVVLKQKVVPESLKLYRDEFKKLQKQAGIRAEEEWAFRRDWTPCGYWDPDVWVRMKVDCYYPTRDKKKLIVIDYKTGKVYEENKAQCSFYALGGFIMHPDVENIHAELWYVDQGPAFTQTDDFGRHEVGDIRAAWEYEVEPMLNDTIFAPRPGWYCRSCFYNKNKNGNCEFC